MICDNDILVDLIRGHAQAHTWLASLPQRPYASGFAAMELLSGSRDAAEERRVRRFLAQFPLLWPTEVGLTVAFTDYSALYRTTGIGVIDCLIAATATEHHLPLLTFNVRHFRHIPGLVTEQPYTR